MSYPNFIDVSRTYLSPRFFKILCNLCPCNITIQSRGPPHLSHSLSVYNEGFYFIGKVISTCYRKFLSFCFMTFSILLQMIVIF